MGLFGGKKERPEIHVPTAEELLGASAGFVRGQFPEFAGARETGLAALTAQGFDPQITIPGVAAGQFGPTQVTPAQIAPVDFAQFGPTSFEQALGAQHFENVWPDVQRQIKHALSLSGMATSPILAEQLGGARGQLGVDIGSVLANLGQRRGELEQQRRFQQAGFGQQAGLANVQAVLQQQQLEQQRLQQQALSTEAARQFQLSQAIGQDPFANIFQGAVLGQQQSARQAQEMQARFEAEQAGQGGGSSLLALLGGGLGALLAAPTGGLSLGMGAALGGAAGGTLGSAFGGGPSPIGFQDVALMSLLGGLGGLGAGAGAGVSSTEAIASGMGGAGGLGFGQKALQAIPVGGF